MCGVRYVVCCVRCMVCGVSTANSQLIQRKYGVTEFILSTIIWTVMLMSNFGRCSSGRCHTCNEAFLINQITIIK
jgi:hypothetical protein